MKKILIVIIAIMMLSTLSGCGKKETEKNADGTETVNNEKLKEDKTLDGLKFSNDSIIFDGSNTQFSSSVKNTTKETKEVTYVKATVVYEDSNKVERAIELLMYFGESIEPGQVRTTTTVVDTDLRKTLKVDYELVK